MELAFKPFFVQDDDVLLGCDEALLDIEWDFKVDRGILDVVVEVDHAACVDLQVRVGCLEFIVREIGEFILNELDPLLYSVKV